MILYQVNVTVKSIYVQEWQTWMCEHHIPDVMKTGCFLNVRMLELMDDTTNGNFVIEYVCKDSATLLHYRQEFSPALQAQHNEKFKDAATSFRKEFTIVFEA
ncbi:MAG TPA: DUF4286 family protein [Candidatus Kapabacteria bacterium]|jgi:hypothetical protein|nr:DUF4286 family protein [Candidatus Kapabacteria bacterium]HRI30679.1 DUF4286 family protein [Candidatus Kapabacteria bacterium]